MNVRVGELWGGPFMVFKKNNGVQRWICGCLYAPGAWFRSVASREQHVRMTIGKHVHDVPMASIGRMCETETDIHSLSPGCV
jgi:hypothetical protein